MKTISQTMRRESTRSARRVSPPRGQAGRAGSEPGAAPPSHRPYAVGLPCPRPASAQGGPRAFHRPPARPRVSRRRCPRPGRNRRRPHVGRLPRRPDVPLGRHPPGCDGPGARRTTRRSCGRSSTGRRSRRSVRRRRRDSVRPGVQVRRRRRVRPERAAARPRGADHALGHAVVGERRPEAAGDADEHRGLPELRARGRGPILGPVRRLPLRALLHDLERVQPRDVPRPAVQRRGQDRQPRELREARTGGDRRDQGGEPQCPGRDRRDLVERPRQAPRRAHRHRRARRPS